MPHIVQARAHTPLLASWGRKPLLVHGPYGVQTSPLNLSGGGIVDFEE
jgi:hypothetical protein